MKSSCAYSTSLVTKKQHKNALRLQYYGGPLLEACEVFTIFWGKTWQTKIHSEFMRSIIDFFTAYLGGSEMQSLSEYNTEKQQIREGRHTGSLVLTDQIVGNVLTDRVIRKTLKQKIEENVFPKPSKNTLYFFFIEEGIQVKKGHDVSCTAFCGYHDVTSLHTYYAVIPYPSCYNCRGNGSITNALTVLSSHELTEAITDPIPGKGWYARRHGEIADICEGDIKKDGKFAVQCIWSNKRGACK